MITKLFVCLFVFVNALKSYTVLLLHCFYTVHRYNQNCCTNFFLWIFWACKSIHFFHHLLILFFVEIVEKLEQSSSWSFFYSKKAHFGTFSQNLAIFLIDDRVAVWWNRFLVFFLLLVMRRDQNTISSRCRDGGLRKDPGQNVYLGVKKKVTGSHFLGHSFVAVVIFERRLVFGHHFSLPHFELFHVFFTVVAFSLLVVVLKQKREIVYYHSGIFMLFSRK